MASTCMRRSRPRRWQSRAAATIAWAAAWATAVLTGSAGLHGAAALAATQAPAGRALYASCAACHGNQGEGRVAVNAPAIAGLQSWYVERQLGNFANGIRGAATGDAEGTAMRAAAGVLKTGAERAAVAAYVAGLARSRVASRTPGSPASQTNGRNYFNALCSTCHGADARGNQALGAPRLAGAAPEYLAKQLAAFKSGRRGAHPQDKLGAQMRAIAAMLPDNATEHDVIDYGAGLPP